MHIIHLGYKRLCFDKEGVEGTAVGPGKAGSEYRWPVNVE